MFQSRAEVRRTIGFQEQFADAYRKAFFGDSVRTLFPGFKVSFFAGGLTPADPISAYWMLENHIKETGKFVNLIFLPNANHFVGFSHVNFSQKSTDCYAIKAPLGRSGRGPEGL